MLRPLDRPAAGQVRRQVGDGDPAGSEVVSDPGLLGAVDQDGVDPSEHGADQLTVAQVRLVGQDVVADEHAAGSAGPMCGGLGSAGVGSAGVGSAGARAAQQGEVGGDDGGDDVDEHDRVEGPQASTGADPRVRAGPAQGPDRPGEGLGLGDPAGHVHVAVVERRREQV